MKLAAYLDDLDPKLAANLERALDSIRDEFDQKIATTVREAVTTAEREREAAEPAEAAASAAPRATVSLDAADELRLAALEIDVATSQAAILETLSRGVLRFASRVAIFVNRGKQLHGWSASGFGEGDGRIKQLVLGGDVPFPLAERVSEGTVGLSSEDCRPVCDGLGAEAASVGVLLPFMLGSQVVGTVYCDRVGEGAFSVSALQLLTYIAGETLETLPVRKRESTATLTLVAGTAAPQQAPPAQPAEPSTLEAEVEPAPAPAAPEPPIEPAAEPAVEEAEVAAESVEDYFEHTPEPAEAAAPAEPAEAAMPSPPEAPVEDLHQAPAADAGTDSAHLPAIDEESTRPGVMAPETAAIEPTPEIAAPPSDGAPAPADAPVSLSSTQVAPPSDLQGPGWAFTEPGADSEEAGSEAEHEEAKRLARLLVTEIKLYNEEAVDQGRQSGDIYTRLQEDIDRSRQIFEDRIDPAVREENDYFKQALVRILAGGDPEVLGI